MKLIYLIIIRIIIIIIIIRILIRMWSIYENFPNENGLTP